MLRKEEFKKKIIFIGPPASGKTTIIKAFFKNVNPVKLLEFSLAPTKGINSEIYSYFDVNLAIYDLAGQENRSWFVTEKSVFQGSNVVICVFDITDPLKTIIDFIIKIFKIKRDLNLPFDIRILLHKIDLVTFSYPNFVIKFIEDQLNFKGLKGIKLKTFCTSITQDFFWESYDVILSILHSINNKKVVDLVKNEIDNLKIELHIILKCKYKVQYSIFDIRESFNLTINEILFHINRLKQMGFVRIPPLEPTTFFLTNRAYWFSMYIKKKEKIDKELDNEYLLLVNILNLKKVSSTV
jgi:GTPase SAR1 family protein